VAAEPRRASAALATAIGPGGGQTFGRYTLVDRIGEGGMSEIYTAVLAGAEGFQRMYVVKRLKPELALSKGAIEQFIDEAKLGSMLVHSNIVPVLDFGKIGDGYFLAAEYIVGRNLAEVIDRSVQRTGLPLPIPIACYVAHEVLEALAYAHDKTDDAGTPLRIVHRDVSPANVMATAQGEVKLLDFGIVKAEQRKARTESGNVKGNASFMSPEQARGQLVDARSDVFALGLVLYYLVSGQPLYPGATTAEVFYRAASGPTAEELARLRRLPAPLDQLVERALAIDPAARFPSARAFADALASFVPGSKAKLAALMDALFRDELRRPGRTGSSVAAGRS
jgi:serine/threonine-protein kinase